MHVSTVEEYYQRYHSQSRWLNKEEHWTKVKYSAVFSIESLRDEVRLRKDEADGTLSAAKRELRAVNEEWERYNSAQPFPKDEPKDQFLERINKAQARIRVIKEEIAALETIIEEHDQKKAREELEERRPRRLIDLGHGKMHLCPKCGRQHLKEMDTRPVGCDGTFRDMDSDLSWHPLHKAIAKISDVKEYVMTAQEAKRDLQKKRHEQRKKVAAQANV